MSTFPVIPLLLFYLFSQCKGDCTFPSEWSGKWFQAGIESYVEFNSTYMLSKGSCYSQSGDKFILQDRSEDESNPAYKCLVIFLKHANVIQYKEAGRCEDNQNDLLECCSFYSDNTLNTLIRVDKTRVPIPCPFSSAPYSFSYSNGGDNVCDRPLSRVDSCIDSTKLLFRFSACADIKSSQYSDEEMTCLGSWRENSNIYMIAHLADSSSYVPQSDESQYRCFMFNRDTAISFNMSQSGDATCNALLSPNEGSKTFKLTKAEGAISKCKFPTYVVEEHIWRSLDGSKTLVYMSDNDTLRINDSVRGMEINIYCQSIESTNEHKHQKYKAFALSGCYSGYMCVNLFHRDSHIIQVQYSDRLASNLEDACLSPNMDVMDSELVTMIKGEKLLHKPCPELGRWGSNKTEPIEHLSVGCDSVASSIMLTEVASIETGYQCLGHWGSLNDTGYILAARTNKTGIYCFIYNGTNNFLSMSRALNSCQSSSSDNFNYRLSYLGRCVESTSHLHSSATCLQATILFLLAFTYPLLF